MQRELGWNSRAVTYQQRVGCRVIHGEGTVQIHSTGCPGRFMVGLVSRQLTNRIRRQVAAALPACGISSRSIVLRRASAIRRQGCQVRRCRGGGSGKPASASCWRRCSSGHGVGDEAAAVCLDAVDFRRQFCTTLVHGHPLGGGLEPRDGREKVCRQYVISTFQLASLSRLRQQRQDGAGAQPGLIKPTSWWHEEVEQPPALEGIAGTGVIELGSGQEGIRGWRGCFDELRQLAISRGSIAVFSQGSASISTTFFRSSLIWATPIRIQRCPAWDQQRTFYSGLIHAGTI